MFIETTHAPLSSAETPSVNQSGVKEYPPHYELIEAYLPELDSLLSSQDSEQIETILATKQTVWSSPEHKRIMETKFRMYLRESGYDPREVSVYDTIPTGKHGANPSEEAKRVYVSAERMAH